jgi:2-phosphosulfolactate phosphatase
MRILCDWGLAGVAQPADVAIIVDVMSFSTCVCVAAERGARIFPFWGGEADAEALAHAVGADLAASRRDRHALSLSPSSLTAMRAGQSLVLPSPNGARCSLVARAKDVLCGSLRNAAAVARAAARAGETILVAPAGERWPDGALRVAFEDMVGAGAIISCLASRSGADMTPEARAAAAAFEAARPDLRAALFACASGQELVARGFPEDVALAAELDASGVAPLLSQHRVRYREAAPGLAAADPGIDSEPGIDGEETAARETGGRAPDGRARARRALGDLRVRYYEDAA